MNDRKPDGFYVICLLLPLQKLAPVVMMDTKEGEAEASIPCMCSTHGRALAIAGKPCFNWYGCLSLFLYLG